MGLTGFPSEGQSTGFSIRVNWFQLIAHSPTPVFRLPFQSHLYVLLLTLNLPMGLMGNSKLDPRGFKASSSALPSPGGDALAGLLEG